MPTLIITSFAAGMAATVNPCGFAMLPAYLGLLIGDNGARRRSGLRVGAAVAAGAVAVFVVAGLFVAAGLRAVVTWIPWLALVVGLALVVAGLAELRGRHLFARLPRMTRSFRDGSILGLIGFGAAYGVTSLSCTLPIFLSLVAASAATGSAAEAIGVLTAYGVGMTLVLIVVTLAVATGRDRIVSMFRPVAARLSSISGWVMAAAGLFIIWYWATVLTGGAAGLGFNPLIRRIEDFTATVAGVVSSNPLPTALGLLVTAVLMWGAARRSTDPTPPPEDDQTDVERRQV